ncbi:MAG: Ribonuclease, partial [Solirubrobacteraceae bacterium]|nr:Ribonuclease [Solirubrobacteraceae bacterium]
MGGAEAARPRGSRRQPARRGRLSRSAEFDRVYRHGRSHANRYLVLYAFPREGDG